ncbi:MAG: sigma-70 family RNA polymerase sigma factor [Acidobacteria bacterium]|nr:sigma-70 family RNA polymerase sigma factor [Acidobacteriota bacterium]
MENPAKQQTEILVDHLFRHEAGKIVATLVRIFGSRYLDLAEDVVQDTMIRALQLWPFQGIPENPEGWLTLTAKRRVIDLLRREASLADKITEIERNLPQVTRGEEGPGDEDKMDDELSLIFMCCHPAIPRESQVALTLKTACGFSIGEVARAFLIQQATIAQRIVRAKRQIRERGIVFEIPIADQLSERLNAVLQVLYLLFNEGHSATQGENLVRDDFCEEAIRLGLLLARHPRTGRPEVHALLALMMLQAARLPARTKPDGAIALLADQDRSQWNQRLIGLGMRHLAQSAGGSEMTSYHLQAEIAAIHATANSDAETDWARITTLYDQLHQIEPSPIVALNRAVALSRWRGPWAGINALNEIKHHPMLSNYHLLPAVLADLWNRAGDATKAAEYYSAALNCPCTEPERRLLQSRLENERALCKAEEGKRNKRK